ncbi:MAG: hypothetical protein FJY95_20970 [Candidatus Handelsmanbacteria bacterium]|nr:hypothetical protein [Candidatus Handelsmanbacteria bacterium]
MKLWMDVMRDLESVMANHEVVFDAWAEGGVVGVVLGPLVFGTNKLSQGARTLRVTESPTVTYDPNPEVYRRLGVEAPPAPERKLPEQRALFEKTLQSAADHGFAVSLMYADSGAGPGGKGHYLIDDHALRARAARMIDTVEHYPMAQGAVMDGPEWGYEIAAHHMNHRSYIFHDLPESGAPVCAALGYDYKALVAAKDRLFDRLHKLDARQVRLHRGGGLLGAFHMLGADPDLLTWMKFRSASMTSYLRRLRQTIDAHASRPIKLSIGPRSAAFAPLTGMEMGALGGFMDYLHPKHYFFHRGFDGFVGTVYRWVETLCAWNPGLSDADALGVVEALFGIELPGVEQRVDFESALSPEFFKEVVTQETRRALAAVDDPTRLVPWLDTGRFPHDGDPMSARDLRMLLEAAGSAGLERFLYHHQGNLTPGEWVVMSQVCGREWNPRSSPYHPADELIL